MQARNKIQFPDKSAGSYHQQGQGKRKKSIFRYGCFSNSENHVQFSESRTGFKTPKMLPEIPFKAST